jgi:hypothetical protein
LEQLVEEIESVVAEYLAELPQPTPETTLWYISHLLDRAGLDPQDVTAFPFGAQLQTLPNMLSMVLSQSFGQQELESDAIAAAEQMLLERPHLLERFEFLFVAYCACSSQQ